MQAVVSGETAKVREATEAGPPTTAHPAAQVTEFFQQQTHELRGHEDFQEWFGAFLRGGGWIAPLPRLTSTPCSAAVH